MRAKEMILDFVQYAFFVVLIAFAIVFFVVGDRFRIFTDFFLKMALPIGLAGLLLVAKLRQRVNDMQKLRHDDMIGEVITYITKRDKIKDLVVTALMPVLMMAIAVYDADIEINDIIQSLSAAGIMLVWHRMLFKQKDEIAKVIYLTVFDKYKDELVIFTIPLAVMLIGIKGGNLDLVDWLQAAFSFSLLYIWHHFIFKYREK